MAMDRGQFQPGLSMHQFMELYGAQDWAHFMSVLGEDSQVLNDFGTVAHSRGFRRSLFNTAEGRLSGSARSTTRSCDGSARADGAARTAPAASPRQQGRFRRTIVCFTSWIA